MRAVALPRNSKGKKYVKIAHKVADGDWPVTEVLQAAAVGPSAQHAAKAEKGEETQSKNDEVIITEGTRKMEEWMMY